MFDYLITSKTGILTQGAPRLVSVLPSPLNPCSESLLIKIAASAEFGAQNSLADALKQEAASRNLTLSIARNFHYFPGLGIEAWVSGHRIHLGNVKLMQDKLILLNALKKQSQDMQAEGLTVVYLAVDGTFVGFLAFEDPHQQVEDEIKFLHNKGISVAILSGDHTATASALASRLGIERVHAELDTHSKLSIIKKLSQSGHVIASLGTQHDHHLPQSHADISILHGHDLHKRSPFVYHHQVESFSDLQRVVNLV